MSVALDGAIIRLSGACRVEEAEALLVLLQAAPGRTVEMSGVTHLHAAICQVLLAFRPAVTGAPADPFIETWLMPLIRHPTVV